MTMPIASSGRPDRHRVVSEHLGHRKLDTTRRYYAREQTRIATRRYHAVLIKRRSRALGAKLPEIPIEDEPR
jgi:integrase